MSWIMSHWMELLLAATGVVTAASLALKAIAPLTKNTKDDKWAARFAKAVKWLEKFALNTK